ncbi:hypothetical protein DPMN_121779 [Dreissena polymorpha]|uniref:Uncharacterized protein n=1 Tax=Dreissena polymorpha TaxID=45954 RepID=A0A9D4GRB2_DREPO|nr:hypothetical protein DPMN_121779 [Dreissena polymorpha]
MIGQKNVTSRVFTSFYINIRKLPPPPPPPTGHVIQLTRTIFKLNSHIKEKTILTKFHENWAKIEQCPAHWRPCFFTDLDIFKLIRDINKTNVKTAPPTGGHIGHEIFELNRDFIETKLLTKFHKDRTINVASRVFTSKC